jgi:putative phosphoesterase
VSKIGLLSDSHGRAGVTRRAVRLLIDAGADHLVHLGDVETVEVIDALLDEVPTHLVFGNTDWDHRSLARYADSLGIAVQHPMGRLELEGRVLVFTHGDRVGLMEDAIRQPADYLCHGHTHSRRDERIGRTRVINPGALHRAAEYSVAILDLPSDDVTFYPVPRE